MPWQILALDWIQSRSYSSAELQIRDSDERGGLGLKSVASITVPAFMAATIAYRLPSAQHSPSSLPTPNNSVEK
jgi:hypothetical protein